MDQPSSHPISYFFAPLMRNEWMDEPTFFHGNLQIVKKTHLSGMKIQQFLVQWGPIGSNRDR